MPPVILWALGALGAAVVVKWLAKEGKRVNAELDVRKSARTEDGERPPSLKRDPRTGVYRPG